LGSLSQKIIYFSNFQIANFENMENLQISAVPLVEALARELSCDVMQLTDRLNHPLFALKADIFLRDKKLRTTYAGVRDVFFSRLTRKSAHQLYAYEGYLEVTVR
jgi:hypothetical protein